MNTFCRYVRLTPFERRIVFQGALGLAMTWAGLRMIGFGRWKRVVARWTLVDRVGCDGGRIASICETIIRMQVAAERYIFLKPSCLEHSLVLWWLLRRHGVLANMCIGGRKEQGRFAAHAWVEVDGVPVGDVDGAHRHFAPFDGPVTLMESQTR
jgi:Transglutaminase-like superfamily